MCAGRAEKGLALPQHALAAPLCACLPTASRVWIALSTQHLALPNAEGGFRCCLLQRQAFASKRTANKIARALLTVLCNHRSKHHEWRQRQA